MDDNPDTELMNTTPKMLPDHFDFICKLGEGGYGRVFQVRKKSGVDKNKFYAIKVIYKIKAVKSDRRISSAITERNILKSIKHQFLVDLKYAFQTTTKLYLVMDFVNGGDLFSLLGKEKTLSEKSASFYVEEILLALQYLHENNILYRDLKPENTLIDRNGHIKLTDFGLSRENFDPVRLTNSICGTVHYSAPEIVNGSGHGKEADWWSLGVLLYEMIIGNCPFDDNNKKVLIQKIIKGKYKVHYRYMTYNAQDLIRKLLKPKVSCRLGVNGAEEIKKHRFFQLTNWDKVSQGLQEPPFVPLIQNDGDVSLFSKCFTEQPVKRSGEKYTISQIDNANFKDFDFISPAILDECNNNN